MRKQIIRSTSPAVPTSGSRELDIADLATVLVTSETPTFPVENVFDDRRGPGGSRWVAAEPGEQALTIDFDVTRSI